MRLIVSISTFLISIVGYTGSSYSQAAELANIQSQCRNITPQQRQMAKAAGYDVDQLCSSVSNLNSQESTQQPIRTVIPRGSAVEMNSRGVIGEPTEPVSEEVEFVADLVETTKFIDDSGLTRYGYDLFAGIPTTFAPATDIPVPVNYVMGPGDQLQIQLLGKVSQNINLTVSRDGTINFPELGPISLAGLNFTEAKSRIQETVKEQMIGVRAVISLGELRSIRVFVLGEAFKPGSYTVSALSTMTNALFVSGGVKEFGSLRNIQLKRQGEVITTLDLYDLLQKGDTSGDQRLQPGDVIYIPPVGKTAGITGEVKRPAVYELKNENNLESLIQLAGGYSASAYPNISHITRKSNSGFTTVIDVDLTTKQAKSTRLKDGDLVEISTVLDEYEGVVGLTGTFHRPRKVKWKQNLTLGDVITSIRDFKENTDLNIALIIRKSLPLREISVLHFNPRSVIEGGEDKDILLKPLDRVVTFSAFDASRHSGSSLDLFKETDPEIGSIEEANALEAQLEKEEIESKTNFRVSLLTPVIEKLKEQTSDGQLVRIVEISGNVRFPGVYPLSQNMNTRDLILLAGGLREAAYLGNAEITRKDLSNFESASVEHINVNLAEQLTGRKSFELQPKDKLAVYTTPEYRERLNISLQGEVRFPGEYEFKRGETLSQVISRAGGFTPMAHIQAAVFTREALKLQESARLEELRERMRADIAASELEEVAAGEAAGMNNAEALLNALSETEAVGRLVIDLERIVSNEMTDIQLQDGDQLIIPAFRQEISVLGEVQHATSHLFNEQWTLEDYLDKSGGLTGRADDDRIYVVKADGSVFLPNQSGWLTHQNEMLNPGDTIVVPLDTDRIKSLTLWTNVSQIVYQLALGAAAVKSL
ncbi:SLBB domain-containing protein [Aliikangiella marina]|nr:SLBB domain-containing protein [Aliikangiella marina]